MRDDESEIGKEGEVFIGTLAALLKHLCRLDAPAVHGRPHAIWQTVASSPAIQGTRRLPHMSSGAQPSRPHQPSRRQQGWRRPIKPYDSTMRGFLQAVDPDPWA